MVPSSAMVASSWMVLRWPRSAEGRITAHSEHQEAFHTPNKAKLVLSMPIKTQTNQTILDGMFFYISRCPLPCLSYLSWRKKKRKSLFEGCRSNIFDLFCFTVLQEDTGVIHHQSPKTSTRRESLWIISEPHTWVTADILLLRGLGGRLPWRLDCQEEEAGRYRNIWDVSV